MENPLVTLEELRHSASAQGGLPWEVEERFRFLGCHLVARGGRLLGMPQSAVATGQILLHQFYVRRSFLEVAVLDLAMAALFVAGKVEESYRRARDLVNVFFHLYQGLRGLRPSRTMSYISPEYYEWRERLTRVEMLLLGQLGFRVQPKHPAVLLIHYLEAFGIFPPAAPDGYPGFPQLALSHLNDSLRTVACLRYQPTVIACAAIQLTADTYRHPEDGSPVRLPDAPPWHLVFDVREASLAPCVRLIRRAYDIKYDPDLPLIPPELEMYASVFREVFPARAACDRSSSAGRSRSPHRPSPPRSPSRRPPSPRHHHRHH